jgi:hypothetical protein
VATSPASSLPNHSIAPLGPVIVRDTVGTLIRDSIQRVARHVVDALESSARSGGSPTVPSRRPRHEGRHDGTSPGQAGPHATTEVDSRTLERCDISYNPDLDGEPDPGEVIWTWVPYEEADGRGKDRPALVIAREDAGTVLALQLSSRDHRNEPGWVLLGRGGWDDGERSSWVDLTRILRVHPEGMRREGDIADRDDFQRVRESVLEYRRW